MGNVFLIGGGEIDREPKASETYELDRQILQTIPAEKLGRPIIFIGAAAGDAPGYFETFRDYYVALRAELGLPEVKIGWLIAGASVEEFRETILDAALVYLGGGETKMLLGALEKWGARAIFREALESGAVLAGMSAGAYSLAAKSIHIEDGAFEVNDGLGIVPVICQAHATFETTARAKAYLAEHPEKLPLVALAEGEMEGFRI